MSDLSPDFVRQLAGLVPVFAQAVRYDGPHRDAFVEALRGREYVVVQEGASEEAAFDGVVTRLAPGDTWRGGRALQEVASALRPDGCGLVVVLPGVDAPGMDEFAARLGEVGLVFYRHNVLAAGGPSEARVGYVAFVVHSTYNPMLHARDLLVAGHADWAWDVLSSIPAEAQHDPNVAARVASEKMVCLLAWDREAGERDRLARFFYSQVTFYGAVAIAPEAREVYLCQGEFWKRIGDPSMRRRLLRSAFHSAPPEERAQIVIPIEAAAPARRDVTPPAWRAPERLPRVLFVTHPRPHYGLDVQYYGLCEVLGDANVVEFPYKPTLHGARPDELAHYPCMFSRAGTPLALRDVIAQLERGAFDLVVYGDIEGGIDSDAAKAIVTAAGRVPVVLFDAQDDPLDQWAKMNEYVGGGLRLHFKREMLVCWDYGAHTAPMPFGYPDDRVPDVLRTERDVPLFWAGHRQFGLRRPYLERVESRFGMDLGKTYTQEEYAAALGGARIGLNIFGYGFDTVRYWEVPAHGAMLLAERLPILVPHDFVDGESAVFFDDLPDLEEKLGYWLARPDDVAEIAARGHEHVKRFHTASARARQMLAWVHARTAGGCGEIK